MKNKSHSIKNIFITKMAYSAIIQFVIFVFILMFVREYFHNQISSFSKNLIINDSFTTEEIGRYHLLNNKDALDLVLLNIGNERKLDSIKFIPFPHHIEDLGSCEDSKSGNLTCKSKNGQVSGVTTLKNNGSVLGYVVAKKQYNSIYAIPTSYSLLLIFIIVVGIFLFNFLFLFLSMRKKIASNTEYLLHFISSHQANNTINFSKIKIDEYKQIAHKFIDKHREIISLQQEKAFYEVKKNLAEQLAHDIRSPLTAINTALSDVSSISENKRIMIKNASNRINDIANNLLLQSKEPIPDSQINHENTNNNPELIFVVIDAIVSEKRYEYHSTDLNLELKSSEDSYGCFSMINLGYFKSILSNLINNSIEAIGNNGSILISVTCNNSQIEIIIEDDGCGIPSNILPKVTDLGFSFNKKEGAGLGLAYAKKHLHNMNGTIKIESEESVGTKITIHLIKSNAPPWFCDLINIKNNTTVIVLDDDRSVHNAWDERFENTLNIKIIHFYNIQELSKHKVDPQIPVLYLIDYELLPDAKNGLDVIEDLKLNNKAVLVTSCFEDVTIRDRCKNIGVKIIPKPYVPYIKIIKKSDSGVTDSVVFIDNDEMMRKTWMFAAEDAGKKISTYPSFNEFTKEINNYDQDTVIYIDSDLGNNIKGELCAKYLFDKGFTEIHVATGYPKDRFNYMPWIKSIVGKEPPFTSNHENSI